ncbi:MAG: HTTM domain-containing protein [Myxococcota bacterium]
MRIGIGLYAWVYLVVRFGGLVGVSRFAERQFDPAGPVAVLTEPLPVAIVATVTAAAVVAGAAFVLGYRYRIAGPAFAALFLWVTAYRNSWGMVFHTENLMVMHIVVLGLAPRAADAWSLDARGRPEAKPDAAFGWPIALMCAVTVTTYVLAGVAKFSVSGFDWIVSDTLRGLVAHDNLRKIELGDAHSPIGAAMVAQGWLFPPLAAGSMLLELGAPIALLGGRIGRLWCYAAWSFHAGILAIMAILFHYPLLGFAFASFFEVERVGDRIVAWRSRRRG